MLMSMEERVYIEVFHIQGDSKILLQILERKKKIVHIYIVSNADSSIAWTLTRTQFFDSYL